MLKILIYTLIAIGLLITGIMILIKSISSESEEKIEEKKNEFVEASILNPEEAFRRQQEIIEHQHNLHIIDDYQYKQQMDELNKRINDWLEEHISRLEERVLNERNR